MHEARFLSAMESLHFSQKEKVANLHFVFIGFISVLLVVLLYRIENV